jgi:hypothetical protein
MRKILKRYDMEIKLNLAAFAGILLYVGIGVALAQDAPKNAPAPTATPAPVMKTGSSPGGPISIEDKKSKPVILEKPQLLELSNLELRLENARLKAEAAIPQAVKDEMKKIGEELDRFWADRGIKRDELATKWQGSKGVDGAVILTPVSEKPVAPAPEKK